MQPISSSSSQRVLLTLPTPVKKTTEIQPSAGAESCGSPDNIDRFSILPNSLAAQTQEWLDKRDEFQLIQAGKQAYDLVQWHFRNRLNSERLKSIEPLSHTYAYLYYHSPELRRDRHIPSDPAGLRYLSNKGIYYPLTEKIRTGQITVEQAMQYRLVRTRSITNSLTDPDLTPKQKRFLHNRLFSEHITSGRCSLSKAREMSDHSMNLFYSMTLQHLFRTGRLALEDLDNISDHGMSLLHDPQVAHLYIQGWISKQQLLDLTQVQLDSILICFPALVRKQLSAATVLALNEKQIKSLQNTGLAEQVHTGRVCLVQALESLPEESEEDQIPKSTAPNSGKPHKEELSSEQSLKADAEQHRDLILMPVFQCSNKVSVLQILSSDQLKFPGTDCIPSFSDIIHQSTNVQDRIQWIKIFGKAILSLRYDEILRYFNCSPSEYVSIFERLEIGLDTPKVAELAGEYMDLLISSKNKLSYVNYLRLLTPFIVNDFGGIMSESFKFNAVDIIRKCGWLWSTVRSSATVIGTSMDEVLDQALAEFDTNIHDGPINSLSPAGIIGFGQLLRLMDLSSPGLLFTDWPRNWTIDSWKEIGADRATIADYFQALMCPYEVENTDVASLMTTIDQRRRQ